jgi:hypothetical protein
MVMMMVRARLNEMKKRLSVQPEPAKYPYSTPVMANIAAYMLAVEPMRIHRQRLELLEFSQFSRHVSDQEWAKSTRRTKPRRMKKVAPMREM